MTEETNPFAGMNVEGAETSKGITEDEKAEMQAVIDTDGDGVVSEEELSKGLDTLADIESDGVKPFQGGVGGTTEEMKQRVEDCEECGELKPTLICPSVASLTKLIPPSQDDANMSHQQDWARHCIKFADDHSLHFLGLCVKTGEPTFKEKK